MAIATLQFPTPIRRRAKVAPRDFARRDRAIELFDALDFEESIRETLGYLLPDLEIPNLRHEGMCFVQGSARVRIRIDQDRVLLSTELAALRADAPATAALRYFLSRLSSTGQMFQPRLRDASITLEFADSWRLLHPLKLIEMLQRLPSEADSNDAWMIEEFAIDTPDREPIAELDDDELNVAATIWRDHWVAVDELMVECRRRRSLRFLDALSTYTADQVRYTLPLYGVVRARLNDSADTFTDKDGNPTRRESTLVKCIKEMRKIGPAELKSSLGHARYAINPLREGSPSLLTSILGGGSTMQTIGELRASGRALEASIELIADYYYLLAHHSWAPEIETALRVALDQVSGKPWRDIADGLWSQANVIARVHGSHGEQDRDEPSQEYPAGNHYDA